MSEYFTGFLPPLYLAILGGIAYSIFKTLKSGISSINEKELLLIMFEAATIFSAIKIIALAIDEKIPLDNNFDRTYLVIGGVLTIVVTFKDIVSKFR